MDAQQDEMSRIIRQIWVVGVIFFALGAVMELYFSARYFIGAAPADQATFHLVAGLATMIVGKVFMDGSLVPPTIRKSHHSAASTGGETICGNG